VYNNGRYLLMNRVCLAVLILASFADVRADSIRFLKWADVQSLVTTLAEKPSDDFGEKEWDTWIRTRDASIRERVERGTEDAISALLIFGTSFTTLPAIPSARDAVNAAGDLTPASRGRLDAFIEGLDNLDTPRFQMALDYLKRRRVPQDELHAFLAGNLRRYAIEQRMQTNAISVEGSFPANFAVDEVLRTMKSKPGFSPRIRRIGVIGPGIDFAGEPGCSDVYPPQSVQPFAVLESVLRLGWAQPSDVQVVAFDLNPFVLSQLRASKSRGSLQLPHKSSATWTAAAIGYWQHFGDAIGTSSPPTISSGCELRAVAVKPQLASRLKVEEMDVVAQFQERSPDQGFELMIATHVLESYDRLEQSLALTSMARMLAPGGLLLASGVPASLKISGLEPLGEHHVAVTDRGAGADIVVYRKR
jgi:hypothetical protein